MIVYLRFKPIICVNFFVCGSVKHIFHIPQLINRQESTSLTACKDSRRVFYSISDPRPAFEPLNYSVFVNENGPALQLILNVSVRSESKEKTRADMLFRIISGLVH